MALFSLIIIFATKQYNTMYKIRRLLVWLRRWKYSRGFGVQSPWAYRFIRYVVNEHYPYYAYNDLLPKYANLPKRTLKLCRLYFRIANYWQPAICLDYGTTSDAYGTYMRKGCHALDLARIQSPTDFSKVELMRLSLDGDYRNVFDKAVQVSDSRTLIVVEQIKRDLDGIKNVIVLDIEQAAKDNGVPRSANVILLGAAQKALGIEYDKLEDAIRRVFGRKGEAIVEANIKALAIGRAAQK